MLSTEIVIPPKIVFGGLVNQGTVESDKNRTFPYFKTV